MVAQFKSVANIVNLVNNCKFEDGSIQKLHNEIQGLIEIIQADRSIKVEDVIELREFLIFQLERLKEILDVDVEINLSKKY